MASSKTETAAWAYTDGLFLSGTVLLLLAIYFQTVLSFYDVFSEEGAGQTHAPLLLLVSIYLIYRKWASGNRQIEIRLNPLAMALLPLLSLVWLAAGLVFVEAGQQAALILMVALVPVSLLGMKVGSRYLIPILLLLTIVPVWPVLIPYLQIMTAEGASLLLDVSGITSAREGYLLVIPNGTFEVADACSGLKFQIVGITLALIHTQLTKVPFRVTIIYTLVAAMLALVSNIIRVYIVVLIGYLYGMQHEYVRDHNFIGWSVFSLLFFVFLFIGERQLIKHQIDDSLPTEQPVLSTSFSRRVIGVISVIIAFSLGPLLYGYYTGRESALQVDLITPTQGMPNWKLFSQNLPDWSPLWTKGDRLLQGRFRSGGDEVDLYATQFQRQTQGHEAVNVSHQVYDANKWSRISRSAKIVELDGRLPLTVEETVLRAPGYKQRLVWQWYRANRKDISTKAKAKMNNLIGVVSGYPDIAVYIVSKEVTNDVAHASALLADFVKEYLSTIDDSS